MELGPKVIRDAGLIERLSTLGKEGVRDGNSRTESYVTVPRAAAGYITQTHMSEQGGSATDQRRTLDLFRSDEATFNATRT